MLEYYCTARGHVYTNGQSIAALLVTFYFVQYLLGTIPNCLELFSMFSILQE